MGESVFNFYKSKNLIHVVHQFDGLVNIIGCQTETLQSTLHTYNKENSLGNIIPLDASTYYIAYITPVVHYTMGGLGINEKAQVLRGSAPIYNLFAAGTVQKKEIFLMIL